jgi:sulfur relay (sulfurtransferase) DsrC/TusE family protein
MAKILKKELTRKNDLDKATAKYLYETSSGAVAKQAYKISGLRAGPTASNNTGRA